MDDLQLLQGEWLVVTHQAYGETRFSESHSTDGPTLGLRLVGYMYAQVWGDRVINPGWFSIDPAANPKHFDLFFSVDGGEPHLTPGIYRLEGDRLTICLGEDRPTDFASLAGVPGALWVYRRAASAG